MARSRRDRTNSFLIIHTRVAFIATKVSTLNFPSVDFTLLSTAQFRLTKFARHGVFLLYEFEVLALAIRLALQKFKLAANRSAGSPTARLTHSS